MKRGGLALEFRVLRVIRGLHLYIVVLSPAAAQLVRNRSHIVGMDIEEQFLEASPRNENHLLPRSHFLLVPLG